MASDKNKSADLMATRQRSHNGRIRTVGDWTEQTSSSGKRYYYHEAKGISQWKKPDVWREYERKLAENREARRSSNLPSLKPNDHKNHSTLKRSSPPNNNGLNGESDERRRILSKPSTSNNTPSSSSRAPKRESAPPSAVNGVLHSSSPHINNLDLNGGSVSSNATPTGINKGTPTSFDGSRSKSARREREPDDLQRRDYDERPKQPDLDSQSSLLGTLQPPPIAPDLLMNEPMDVADSPPPIVPAQPPELFAPPPMPTIEDFKESVFAGNCRFYHSKSCAYRKQITYDSMLSDVRQSMNKVWRSQKDLIELDTNIIAVQSLVLTAHCSAELKCIQPPTLPQQNGEPPPTLNGNGRFGVL